MTPVPGGMKVAGSAPALPAGGSWQVQLYRAAPDPSGFGEGVLRVGPTLPVDASTGWAWSHTDTAPGAKGCYTVVRTRVVGGAPRNSGEFSRIKCPYELHVPLVTR